MIRFVLVRPRTPHNIGSVARVMKNFGFHDLALVDPRLHRAGDVEGQEPAFERESKLTAWGAIDVLESSKRFDNLSHAVSGCTTVLGTAPQPAARCRTLTPEEGVRLLCETPAGGAALVFGSESSGLTSEECARLGGIIVIPTDGAYRDLNLAQSAGLMAYLLFTRSTPRPQAAEGTGCATHGEIERAADGMLEAALYSGFLSEKDAPVGRELRAMLHRLGLTSREVGLLTSLWRRVKHGLEKNRT